MQLGPTIIAAMVILSPISAHAAPDCEQFKAAFIAGAAEYKVPAPNIQPDNINHLSLHGEQYWNITTFGDVTTVMSCRWNSFRTFWANGINGEEITSTHHSLLMAIGLHSYGMEWPAALQVRDQLVRTAKVPPDPHTGYIPINDGKALFVINIKGAPIFGIWNDRYR
jgi:hypothetical protein